MKSIKILFVLVSIFSNNLYSQQKERPKLVVGIVIDQMRAEYLYRFQENYTENGFKRLMRDGFNVKNTHYNYIPTETGPGHASIYTGTTPTNHGIISNYWYERESGKTIYCAEDTNAFLVDNSGIKKDLKYKGFLRSPKNLMTTTITDELKLFTNNRSKVIGISLKDRGAILPAGHRADYAFWYNNKNGNFVTSSFYTQELPRWLHQFNTKKLVDSLMSATWNTFLPIEKYRNSNPDDSPLERVYKGNTKSVFPYPLKMLHKDNRGYQLVMQTPFGNSLLTEFAKATIIGEELGKHSDTDFLTISYSSTDKVGHDFGIRSKELEDTYVRLDREIEKLLTTLDKEVGKGNYTLFLTADHAASDNPLYLQDKKLPGAFYNPKDLEMDLSNHLKKVFGNRDYIAYMNKSQVWLSDDLKYNDDILKEASKFLLQQEGLKNTYIPYIDRCYYCQNSIETKFKNSWYINNSGDILLHFENGYMDNREFGTTHGNAYNSDTHVPLLWYGKSIPQGRTHKFHTIDQIAATLAFILNISLPDAANPNPIVELTDY